MSTGLGLVLMGGKVSSPRQDIISPDDEVNLLLMGDQTARGFFRSQEDGSGAGATNLETTIEGALSGTTCNTFDGTGAATTGDISNLHLVKSAAQESPVTAQLEDFESFTDGLPDDLTWSKHPSATVTQTTNNVTQGSNSCRIEITTTSSENNYYNLLTATGVDLSDKSAVTIDLTSSGLDATSKYVLRVEDNSMPGVGFRQTFGAEGDATETLTLDLDGIDYLDNVNIVFRLQSDSAQTSTVDTDNLQSLKWWYHVNDVNGDNNFYPEYGPLHDLTKAAWVAGAKSYIGGIVHTGYRYDMEELGSAGQATKAEYKANLLKELNELRSLYGPCAVFLAPVGLVGNSNGVGGTLQRDIAYELAQSYSWIFLLNQFGDQAVDGSGYLTNASIATVSTRWGLYISATAGADLSFVYGPELNNDVAIDGFDVTYSFALEGGTGAMTGDNGVAFYSPSEDETYTPDTVTIANSNEITNTFSIPVPSDVEVNPRYGDFESYTPATFLRQNETPEQPPQLTKRTASSISYIDIPTIADGYVNPDAGSIIDGSGNITGALGLEGLNKYAGSSVEVADLITATGQGFRPTGNDTCYMSPSNGSTAAARSLLLFMEADVSRGTQSDQALLSLGNSASGGNANAQLTLDGYYKQNQAGSDTDLFNAATPLPATFPIVFGLIYNAADDLDIYANGNLIADGIDPSNDYEAMNRFLFYSLAGGSNTAWLGQNIAAAAWKFGTAWTPSQFLLLIREIQRTKGLA